jgi:polysaccharide biosynthesis protein PslF
MTRADGMGSRGLRVLMLTGEYPPQRGGVADYTARLADGLRQLGHQVSVLTSQAPSGAGDDALTFRRVRDWGFGCWPKVEAAVTKLRPDVLHIQHQAGAYQLKGAVNLLPLWLRRRRRLRLRTVTTFHDLRVPYLFPRAGPLRELAVRVLVQTSHAAIFVDPADLDRAGSGPCRRWIPVGSNVACAPPDGFDRDRARRALGVADGDLLVGYFGFLSASKGAHTLLKALRHLLDDGRPVRLALIGATAGASNPSDRDDEVDALALARSLGLDTRLQLTGYLPPAELSTRLLACDLLALPYQDGASFRRGSLLVGLEHGLPIVTTTPAAGAYGSSPRRLEPGRHFLAAPPNDPPALAAAIARLIDDPQLRARLGREARLLAAQCTWKAIATETAQVYVDCLGALPGYFSAAPFEYRGKHVDT